MKKKVITSFLVVTMIASGISPLSVHATEAEFPNQVVIEEDVVEAENIVEEDSNNNDTQDYSSETAISIIDEIYDDNVIEESAIDEEVVSDNSEDLPVLEDDNTISFEEDLNLEEDIPVLSATFGDYSYDIVRYNGVYAASITDYSGAESNVVIPSSIDGYTVRRIGRKAFVSKSSIKTITIPSEVSLIDEYAFYDCSGLTTLNLSEGLLEIDYGAFMNCVSLKSITIPSTVTSIQGNPYDGVFGNCTSLSSVTIKGNCIGNYMFAGCISLREVTIPDYVLAVGYGAFQNCTGLERAVVKSKVIGCYAFEYCTYLTTVELENTETIEMSAFENSGVREIELPNTIQTIEKNAFCGCSNLQSVIFNEGLEEIAGGAFKGCTSLKQISLPQTLSSISKSFYTNEYGAFEDCVALEKISFGGGYIGPNTFKGCELLTEVFVPSTVTGISSHAFEDCKGMKKITICNSGPIGYCSFAGCTNLEYVNMKQSKVTEIGIGAFEGTSIRELVTPDTLIEIGSEAFKNCEKLSKIVLNQGLISLGHDAFARCKSLVQVNIPSTVTRIGSYGAVFRDCVSLTDVIIKNNAIEKEMFLNCTSLKTVVIPSSVSTISSQAFSGCTSLKQVCFLGNAPVVDGYAFENVNPSFEIQFLEGKLGWTDSTWNGYKTKKVSKFSGDVVGIFDDVFPAEWFIGATQFVYDQGLMSGKELTLFAPNDIITRSEFVTVLYNKEKTPDIEYSGIFSDVEEAKWYSKPISWAAKNNITAGIGDGKFGTKQTITREQLATMLYSYAKMSNRVGTIKNDALNNFPDGNKVSNWANEAMKWAVSKGVMSGKGTSNGTLLDPNGKATRAECAQMIKNYVEKVESQKEQSQNPTNNETTPKQEENKTTEEPAKTIQWGAWSEWSKTSVTKTNSRDVETKVVKEVKLDGNIIFGKGIDPMDHMLLERVRDIAKIKELKMYNIMRNGLIVR